MIIKYLLNTTVIAVDHHAVDNNNDGFYQHTIKFEDKMAKQEAPSTAQVKETTNTFRRRVNTSKEVNLAAAI